MPPPARVLFVSRKFPPSVGGMETLAVQVWQAVSSRWPGSVLIAQGGPRWRSALWVPVGVARALVALRRGGIDAVIAGDAVMATALALLPGLRRRPRVAFVMGLDLTWRLPGYRFLVRRGLRAWPRIAAISRATAAVAAASGLRGVQVVPLGVAAPAVLADRAAARAALDLRWPGAGPVLLTVGRLVTRKGVAWFVEQVLPLLPSARYVVAGDGPARSQVVAAAARAGVADRVLLLGEVDDADRELLLAGCDVFVQPNVAVPGDIEGFGLVVVEAALRGAVPVAADLEGLRDAVVAGQTGLLVPSGDPATWARTLADLLDAGPHHRAELGARFCEHAAERFSEQRFADRLAAVLALP